MKSAKSIFVTFYKSIRIIGMKVICDKRKSLVVIGIVNSLLFVYLLSMLLVLFKLVGKDDSGYYPNLNKYAVTNNIIDPHSSIDSDNSFTYVDASIDLSMRFSSSGSSVSIGTYEPYSYIFGTDDTELYIHTSITSDVKYKIVYTAIYVSDIDGNNVTKLYYSQYQSSYKDHGYLITYNGDSPKYIYKIELSIYTK